jgi:flagella basal body P-ring formation protein FlgA
MKFRHAVFCLLITLPQTGWIEPVRAADLGPVQLLAEAKVDGSGVFLDELVSASGESPVIPHLRLARAPHAGETVTFTRNEVGGLAQSGAGLLLTNWLGADAVKVSRRVRSFEDSDLIDLLTDALQKEYIKNQGDLELHLMHAGPRPLVPDEPLTLQIAEMPSSGVCPNFVTTFELWDGKERVGSWQATVQASVWRDIPIANSPLARGQSLKDADVTMERSDILVQHDAYLNFPPPNDSLELNEGIAAGKPILNRSVRVRPLILRGQLVEGVFQDGALAISLMVETLEDGALGQTVRVMNPTTRRELHGRIENEKTIRITL